MSASALEGINNAIARMEHRVMPAADVPEGRKRAVSDLARHWQRYVWGKLRRTIAPWSLAFLAQGYVRWYTRAYYLLSPEVRKDLVKPQDLDASFAQFADDEIRRIGEAGQAIAKYSEQSAREAGAALSVVASGARTVLTETGKIVLIVGGTIVAVLLAWAYLRGKK